MKRKPILCLVGMMFVMAPSMLQAAKFWEKEPYTEWSAKDARKIITQSPWCYEYRWGNIGNIAGSVIWGDNSEREFTTIFRIAVYSSRTVRQAYIALIADGDQSKFEEYEEFVSKDYDEIVLAMTVDSVPRGLSSVFDLNAELQALRTPDLIHNTYLSSDDGKKVYLQEYIPPTPDGTGAKFVFANHLPDGLPFITPSTGKFRFQTKEFRIKEIDPQGQAEGIPVRATREFVDETRNLKTDVVSVDATFELKRMTVKGERDY
ncbi:MAG: hypothetical protein JXQ27_08770 [Acidobacteria bacterium]|nr:hypothetical protein [Acidobacteriota bacterium]